MARRSYLPEKPVTSAFIKSVVSAKENDESESDYGAEMVCAARLLGYERSERKHIFTFSRKLDEILGGGIATGSVTEVCGLPASGKTQLCLQVCVDAHLPQAFGGLASDAVYVDTDGSFDVNRLREISTAAVSRCLTLTEDADLAANLSSSFTEESVLKGVYHVRCPSADDFLSVVDTLPRFVATHPRVRAVVVDSIAYPFRDGFGDDVSRRTYFTLATYNALLRLAVNNNIAVVVTNQMTTRFGVGDSESTSRLVPALGESWSFTCPNRLQLRVEPSSEKTQLRSAKMVKSSYLPEASAVFQIQSEGIRDAPALCENQPSKRPRIQ